MALLQSRGPCAGESYEVGARPPALEPYKVFRVTVRVWGLGFRVFALGSRPQTV